MAKGRKNKDEVQEVQEVQKVQEVQDTFEELQIKKAFQTVIDAKSLKAQTLAKRQLLIVLNNKIEKDSTLFKTFFECVKDTDSKLFNLQHGAIDEVTQTPDAITKAWNSVIVIVNLLIIGGKLPFDKHGVQAQFTGRFERLGKLLSNAIL